VTVGILRRLGLARAYDHPLPLHADGLLLQGSGCAAPTLVYCACTMRYNEIHHLYARSIIYTPGACATFADGLLQGSGCAAPMLVDCACAMRYTSCMRAV
jgi:hypothetical protein